MRPDPVGQALLREVDFGLEVQQFLRSKIGRYLTERAETQIEEAVEAIKKVDPEDAKAVRALQFTIQRNEDIQYWLAEAITAGRQAEETLQQE